MSLIPQGERRGALLLALAGALTCATIVGLHRASPRTAISAHGFLHAAIVESIRRTPWPLPPENPFFAGEPLPYYWFFHALGAAVQAALGVDPLRALELLVVVATAGLFAAAGWLGRRLLGATGAGLWIAFLVLAGAKPFAAPLLGWRLLRNGPSILERSYLWDLVHPVMAQMRKWDPYSMWGPLLHFFFNITSRPLALAALLGVVAALYACLTRGGWLRAGVLAAAVALCSAFSMLIGVSAAGAFAFALVLAMLGARVRGPGSLGASLAPHAPLALGALLLGVLLALPTFAHLVSGGGAASLALAPPSRWPRALLAMAESACVTLPLGVWAIRESHGARRDFVALLVLACLVMMAAAMGVSLPIGSQNNFFQAALVPMGVAASAALVDARGRTHRWRATLVLVLFVPTAALTVFAYSARPPVPIAIGDGALRRVPADAPLPRLYAWIREHTPPDAVLVIDPAAPIRAMSGNTAELPALTGRTLLTVRPTHYIAAGHANVEERVGIARALVRGEPLAPAHRAALAALGRPIYVVVDDLEPGLTREAARARARRLRLRHGAPRFTAPGIAVYRVADLRGGSS